MKKRTRVLTAVLTVLLMASFLPIAANASAADYGVNINSSAYQSAVNPFYNRYKGQCTWYCWGRAYEKCGVALQSFLGNGSFGNAMDWYTNAEKAGRHVGTVPASNSIMVSPNGGYYDDNGQYHQTGHVMFVEKIENGYAYITEGNYNKLNYHEDIILLSNGKRNSGKGSTVGITGYIYLDTIISLPDGFYFLKSALDENYAIDVAGSSKENGANIQLEPYDRNSLSQIFQINKIDGENSYKIINVNSGQSLDILNASPEPGTNVQQYPFWNWISEAQRWDFLDAGNGYVYVKSHYFDTCLDVKNGVAASGTNIQMYTANQTTAQKFKLCLVPPVVELSTEKAYVGDTVTVSWEEPYGTVTYDSYLTEYPEGYAYQVNTKHFTGWTAGKYEFSDLPAGHYSFFMHAKNAYATSDQSNWVSFDIYEKEYIPTKTETFNGHTYQLYDYEASWSFCKDLCEEFGGHLVTISSLEEETFIESLIADGTKDAYWLGLTNYSGNVDEDNDGSWHWITDETYSYTNWASSEPSESGIGGNREHWAEIRKSYSNKWNDVNNINKANKGFIIEIDNTDIPQQDIDEYQLGALAIRSENGTELETIPNTRFLVTIPITKLTKSSNTMVILASYSASGRFSGLMYVSVEDVPVGATIKITLPVENTDGEIAMLKAFTLTSFVDPVPLGAAVTFP